MPAFNAEGGSRGWTQAQTAAQIKSYQAQDPRLRAVWDQPMPPDVLAARNNTVDANGTVNQANAQKVATWENNLSLQVNAIQNPDSLFDKVMEGLALATTTFALGAVGGAVIAPAVAGAVGGGTAGAVAGGAAGGAFTGAASSALTGKNIGTGALTGALGGGLTSALTPAVSDFTGLGGTSAGALTGAGVGAIRGEVTGQGAGIGALGGAIQGGVSGSGIGSSLGSEIGSPAAGRFLSGLATSELTSLATNTLTSPSGKGASGGRSSTSASPYLGAAAVAAPLTSNTQPLMSGAGGADGASGGGSFLGDLAGGVTSSLGGGSLGGSLGSLLPYAAVGAIGEAQAAKGQAQDAKYSKQLQDLAQPSLTESNQLLGKFNSGTLDPTAQKVVDTSNSAGQTLIDSTKGLGEIAQTAFSNFNSGTLKPADQTALDQKTAAQKQQVAQMLSSAGITDSTVLAAQNQQIDNNALIQKQQLLDNYFSTGNQAYDQWLKGTTEGQQTIIAGQKYANDTLQQTLQNSMQEAGIGISEMNIAIQTQMQTDQNYANEVSTLMGNLAQAYAMQVAGSKSGRPGGGGGGGSNLIKGLTGGGGGGGGGPISSGTGLPTDFGSGGTAGYATDTAGNIDPSLAGDIAASGSEFTTGGVDVGSIGGLLDNSSLYTDLGLG